MAVIKDAIEEDTNIHQVQFETTLTFGDGVREI
jgi:hypothetical protein